MKQECEHWLKQCEVPQVPGLMEFLMTLLEINKKINLTAARTPEVLIVKHVADVWLATRALNSPRKTVIDVGSGCGIPGILLALFWSGASSFLVERRSSKAVALSQIVNSLSLNNRIQVLAKNFEEIKKRPPGELWFRAFLPGEKLAAYFSNCFKDAQLGPIVLMKGPRWRAEKQEILLSKQVRDNWRKRFLDSKEIYYELPQNAGSRVLVLV